MLTWTQRLADTHDLLAEISLENERSVFYNLFLIPIFDPPRFPGAVTDFRSSLALKEELYPEESEIIAEAHFKLSLALEFASITRTEDQGDAKEGEAQEDETHVDQSLRDEAAKEVIDPKVSQTIERLLIPTFA